MTEPTHTPLPCPFCGFPAEIEEGSDHHGTWFNLGCSRHWGHVRNPDHTNTCIAGRIYYTEAEVPLAEALTAWNTRADSHHRLIEALEAARKIIADIDDYMKRPSRGDWGEECACCMGELLDDDRNAIAKIDAAIKEAGR